MPVIGLDAPYSETVIALLQLLASPHVPQRVLVDQRQSWALTGVGDVAVVASHDSPRDHPLSFDLFDEAPGTTVLDCPLPGIALEHRLLDLSRIEQMVLRRIAGEFFRLPLDDDDPPDESEDDDE